MDATVKQQAMKVIDTLYGWLFDGKGYTAPASAGHCIKEYVDGDEVTSGSIIHRVLGSLGDPKGLYANLQNRAVAVVTSATSAVDTVVAKHDPIGAATTGIPGQGHVLRPSSTFFDNGQATSDSDSLISFFRSFYDNPSTAFDNLLGHHYPHFDSLIAHLGLDELAKSLNCDSRILFLACLLPLLVLLMSACCIVGVGYSTEEPHSPGYHEHKKSDPKEVGGKTGGQGSSSSASSRNAGSPSSSSSPSKSSKGKGKKGGTHDDGEPVTKGSASAGSHHLGNSNLSSWGSMLGSSGFRGADVLDFKPFDIYAAMDATDRKNRVNAPKLSRHGSAIQGEGIVSSNIEDIIGTTEAQHGQGEIARDNQEGYIESISDFAQEFVDATVAQARKFVHIEEINTEHDFPKPFSQVDTKGKQGGPAGPDSGPQLRTRIPRPHGFKEADRHRHQPHIPSSSFASSPCSSSRQQQDDVGNTVDQGHGDRSESIAAKIVDFAQGNSIMKNLDGISGGVLNATVVSVAALANTAEAATTYLKENMPSSISQFFNDLQESFDESMENGGLEGTGFDDQRWASNVQITELPDKATASKTVDSRSYVSTSKKSSTSTAGPSKARRSTFAPMANKNKKAAAATAVPSTSGSADKAAYSGAAGKTNKGHTMAANPPHLRQPSVGHVLPETNVDVSSAAVPKSNRKVEVADIHLTEDISCDPVNRHVRSVDKSLDKIKGAVGSSNTSAHKVKDAAVNKVQEKVEDADKTAKKVASDVTKTVDSGLTSAHKAKYSAVHDVQNKAKQADSASMRDDHDRQKAKDTLVHDVKNAKETHASVKKAPLDTKKTVEAGVSYAQMAKNTRVKDTRAAVHGTETTVESAIHKPEADVHKAAEVARGTVTTGFTSAQKNKEADVARAQSLTEGAENAAVAIVGQAEAIVNSAVETAQHVADAAVYTVQDKVLQADIALHDAVDIAQKSMRKASDTAHHVVDHAKAVVGATIAAAKHDVEQVEHLARGAVKSTLSTSQYTQDTVAYAAEAEMLVDATVKIANKNIDSTTANAQHNENKLAAKATKAAKKATKSARRAAKGAKKATKGAKKAVDNVFGPVNDTEKNVESATRKVTFNAAQVAKDMEKKVETTAKAASSTAHMARDKAAQAIKDAEKKVEDTVHTASVVAQKAKESATQAAMEIHKRTESAVDSAFNAAMKAKFDASHVAKEVEKSIESARKAIEHGMQAASAQKAKNAAAKDVNKTTHETGRGGKFTQDSSQASVKAAMEYAHKTTSDAPVLSAKATLDSALASAHNTENHIAQNLKIAAQKSESAAHKASEDAKAALDSALAAAHKAENNHIDTHPVHLKAYGAPLSAFTSSTLEHSHHVEQAHDIKKAFIYGHNSPTFGNKETRFVGGSPLSSSSSDPKPELKAAHNAHHAHHGDSSADDNHKELKKLTDNNAGGQYNFFLNENDLLDDINADDGHEEDSDEDEDHDHPGHSSRGILSVAPSILHSARSAASAVAALVADASHQQLDNARHRLSSIVDHLADDLAGHDEPENDDSENDGEGHKSALLSRTWGTDAAPSTSSSHHHHVTVEDATDSLSDVTENVSETTYGARNTVSMAAKDVNVLAIDAPKRIPYHLTAFSKTDQALYNRDHKNHGDSVNMARKDSEGVYAYKPTPSSTRVDKDGFILVEAPENMHEHESEQHGRSGHHCQASSSFSSSTSKDTTSTASVPAKFHAASSQQHTGATMPKKHSTPAMSLSYSNVVQLHKSEYDHGSQLGITENRSTTAATASKPPINSFFQNEDYEQFRATTPMGDEIASVISHGGDQIMPVTLNAPPTAAAQKGHQHHYHQQQAHVLTHHPHDTLRAPRRISSGEPTTTLSLEHGRGYMQGVERTREAHGGKKSGVEEHREGAKEQLTVDAQGNKVPLSSARRDSGYDLLM